MLTTGEATKNRVASVMCTVAFALAVLAAGCTSAYMKTYSDSSKLAPDGALKCAVDLVTELGYQVTDSNSSEGTLEAQTERPTVMSHDGRALVYNVSVTVTKDDNSADSTIEVITNNESHARIILRTCSRKEEAIEEEKQARRSALEPHHLTTGDQ